MTNTNFITACNCLSRLDEAAAEDIAAIVQTRYVPKGGYLLKSGALCRHLFYIEEGLVKTFFKTGDKEFIMRFFPEQALFTVLDSFVTQTPSTYSVLALEPVTVSYIHYTDLNELCQKHHSIETFFRKLVSLASVNMMKRISEMLEENGTQRYHHFVTENNHLLQRISLGDLASYLGITQVSLSRIRARK